MNNETLNEKFNPGNILVGQNVPLTVTKIFLLLFLRWQFSNAAHLLALDQFLLFTGVPPGTAPADFHL